MKASEIILLVIVLLLIANMCSKEPFYGSNWTGEPGALSIRPVDKVFYNPND